MGWCLGVASYQAAVGEEALAYNAIVDCAQPNATRLKLRGFVREDDIVKQIQSMCCAENLLAQDLHQALVLVRGWYQSELGPSNVPTNRSDAYRLGLFIGLAEAQCTSPVFNDVAGAWFFAHDALDKARTLIATSGRLSQVGFDRSLLTGALNATDRSTSRRELAYDTVVKLRNSYGEAVTVSNL
jgi:hypothetical protein